MPTNRENEDSDQDDEMVEPEEIGKPHPTSDRAGERARDEQREDGGPRYGGEAWEVADERGDQRFGKARNDDADPSELAKGEANVDDDQWPGDDANPQSAPVSDVEDNGRSESGAQQAGMGRGGEPRKPKNRSKR